ncbi:MAG: asparagine synthase (glutamine-hydrolyzing) [Alphaproteobacteria bacterium]|nr:asparagine synthase (glutamine-hydrolyzing) [Alphaproteobacteria bacterium]
MCGIAGFVGPGDRGDLARMTRALLHRGPDGEGLYSAPDMPVHLGHRRLAIVDIAGGYQPMWDGGGDVGVVFNGEIYNHLELRRELQAKGHKFQTDHSDTEVLVHGYKEWGEDLPRRLNGMFSFCIFDRPRRRLFLARDRFGEKPLYYAFKNGFFGFASELSALAEHPAVGRTIDGRALQKLFGHGFIPAPNAFLEGTRKLPGGCWMRVDADGPAMRVERYWRFALEPDEGLGDADEPRLIEELRSLLDRAVQRRMMSDVPLGVFLSGGIDSSTTLIFASRHETDGPIRTFTIGFNEASYDESPYAESVARRYGAHHRVDVIDVDHMRDEIRPVLAHLDEPMADASILPCTLLCRFARRHVTVALSGDGGDELFAGYDPFRALGPARLYHSVVPKPMHRMLDAMAARLPVSVRNMSIDFKLKKTLSGLSFPPELWNPAWLAPLDPQSARDVFEEPIAIEDLYSEALALWDGGKGLSLLDRTMEFYTNLYLQDDILTKMDRAAMSASLESRAIFLDNDLVDFCRRLPSRFKFRNGQGKYLLRKALGGMLDDAILNRPKKGFGIPLTEWLRSVPAEPPRRPIPGVRMQAIDRLWAEHRAGMKDNRLPLWAWLSVQYGRGA